MTSFKIEYTMEILKKYLIDWLLSLLYISPKWNIWEESHLSPHFCICVPIAENKTIASQLWLFYSSPITEIEVNWPLYDGYTEQYLNWTHGEQVYLKSKLN